MSDKNIPDKMLTVEDLEIKFDLRGKTLNAVRGISLDLYNRGRVRKRKVCVYQVLYGTFGSEWKDYRREGYVLWG